MDSKELSIDFMHGDKLCIRFFNFDFENNKVSLYNYIRDKSHYDVELLTFLVLFDTRVLNKRHNGDFISNLNIVEQIVDTHCVAVTDNFWMKLSNEELKYTDVSIRRY